MEIMLANVSTGSFRYKFIEFMTTVGDFPSYLFIEYMSKLKKLIMVKKIKTKDLPVDQC
jgi:hypothetical protein